MEGLKLKCQDFGHLMKTDDSLERCQILGKTEGRRRRGHQRMRRLDGITDAMDMNLGKLREMVRDGGPGVLLSMGSQRVGLGGSTTTCCVATVLHSNIHKHTHLRTHTHDNVHQTQN